LARAAPPAPHACLSRSEDHIMEFAGQRLRRARERLNLKFRDVELASQQIAERHGNQEFVVLISRLSDIESHGTLPSIYRLYSLCCIYRLDLNEVLGWYGIGMESMAADAGLIPIERTHGIGFSADAGAEVTLPISLNPGIDLSKTFFVSEVVQRWGKLPLALVGGVDVRRFRYGFVGTEDWSMHPAIPPGSLLIVDDTKRKIQASGWRNQTDRPVYFLENRDGFYCRWCSLKDNVLNLVPDPSSDAPILSFRYPEEIEVVGQVVGLAMSLDPEKQRRIRS
jgi:transcriptional regulator with XRE-family HTH domain